jgi:hypothetical protein
MNTENQDYQKKKFTALLEWIEDVKFSGTSQMQIMVSVMFEAWLSTDYANKPNARNEFLADTKLLSNGFKIIETFTQEDFNKVQTLIKA